jgi:hypothetical protein
MSPLPALPLLLAIASSPSASALVSAPASDPASAPAPSPAGVWGFAVSYFEPPSWIVQGELPAGTDFGRSVAPAGDVNGDGYSDVIVGAPEYDNGLPDQGRAYLYLGSATGLPTTPAWTWSPGQAGAECGAAVASAGDVNGDGYADVLVGCPGWDIEGFPGAGKVSIFHGSAAGLPMAPTTERTPTFNPGVDNAFGSAVSTAGDVNGDGYADILVGMPNASDAAMSGTGQALVYHGGSSGLGASFARGISIGQAGARTGFSVSTAGDINGDGYADVLVGAPDFDNSLEVDAGRVLVRLGSPTGILGSNDTTLTGTHSNAQLGHSVANAGDVNGDGYADVLIGSPGHIEGLQRGRLYYWRGGPDGLAGTALIVTGSDDDDRLGERVATLGDLDADGYADFAVAGVAHFGVSDMGHVRVYLGGPTHTFVDELVQETEGARFGMSVTTAGDVDGDGFSEILVSDPSALNGNGLMTGEARVLALSGLAPALAPGWPVTATEIGTRLGGALAIAPAIDPSQFPVLLVGDPDYDGILPDGGRVLQFLGTPGGVSPTPFAEIQFGGSGAYAGDAVASVGDVDGNSWGDFVVTAAGFASGEENYAGRVDLFTPDANGGDQVIVHIGAGDSEYAGRTLAGRGDVDGDGFHDFLVGSPLWSSPTAEKIGRLFLFWGGPGPRAPWLCQGTVADEDLGASATLADLDADGHSDVVIGSSTLDPLGTPSGKVQVWFGGPGGPGPCGAPDWSFAGPIPTRSFAAALGSVGDVNGDGVCDLGVGAPQADGFGRAYLFAGSRSRSQPTAPLWRGAGSQVGGEYGAAIAGGGDLDGDGIADFVIGEPGFDEGQVDEGRVHVAFGRPAVHQAIGHPVASDIAGARFGALLAPLADVDLDGFADLVVGAPGVEAVRGRAYVYRGGGGGLPRGIRAYAHPFTALPVFHPHRGLAADGVGVELRARSAEGRARVAVEVEAALLHEPFTGQATDRDGPFDTESPDAGSGSVVLAHVPVGGLKAGTAYRLRARTTSDSPFFPRSRWMTAEAHVSGGHDVWTAGTNVGVPGAGDGRSRPSLILEPIAPNPAGQGQPSRVGLDLPRGGRATVEVFDVRGSRVRRLLEADLPAGRSSCAWDGRDEHRREVPAGLYFVRVRAAGAEERGRLIRLP